MGWGVVFYQDAGRGVVGGGEDQEGVDGEEGDWCWHCLGVGWCVGRRRGVGVVVVEWCGVVWWLVVE